MRRNTRTGLLLASVALASHATAQESDAVLHAPLAVLPVDSAPFQKLVDLDGDGDLDAVGTRAHQSGSGSEIYVWRNDAGAFSLVLLATLPEGSGIAAGAQRPTRLPLAIADFDGNGLEDFAVVAQSRIEKFFSQPGLTFVQQTETLTPAVTGLKSMAAGDFDGDGLADLAIGIAWPSANNSHLVVHFGSGITQAVQSFPEAGVTVQALELDGQPGDDLMVYDPRDPYARLYHVVAGQLTFQRQLFASNPAPASGWRWVGGDVDGDGDVDVVAFRLYGGTLAPPDYHVFRRTGPNAYVPEAPVLGGPAEYLADVDGDGDLDGVCCGGSGGGGGNPYNFWPELGFASTFEIAINQGGGDFAPAFRFPGAGSQSLAGVGDLDADGDVDLVAGRCVFYGDGPWAAQPLPRILGAATSCEPLRFHDLDDVDQDGDPDLLRGRNRGDGSFDFAPLLPAAPSGMQFVLQPLACDVDGDGARDRIRAMQQTATGIFTGLVWQRNNGGGHFDNMGAIGPPSQQLSGWVALSNPDNFLVADFDGDGDEDVFSQLTMELFWNQNGAFSDPAPYQLPVAGTVDGVADFDGDGLLDLAVRASSSLQVLAGTGQPGSWFVPSWNSAAVAGVIPAMPGATVVGDANEDGLPDIVRPMDDEALHLFVNQTPPGGPIAFADVALPIGDLWQNSPCNVTASLGDVDGDGRTDLAVSGILGEVGTVAVLLRQGSGAGSYVVRRFAAQDGFLVDADGDGDLDLVGQYLAKNRRFEGSAAGLRQQRFAGVPGEAGAVPVLGGTGPYRVGNVHTLRLRGIPGPTMALLGLALGEAALPNTPLPGLTLYLDPGSLLPLPIAITQPGLGRAAASAAVPLPIPAGLEGFTFFVQAFVADSAAASGYSQTNLLRLRAGT
ncbi:MAG: FG-GAP repeat domain-containing protein [Planctomycetota bacterium]